MHILAAGVIPQGTKAKEVIAEKGQKVVDTKRSNSGGSIMVVVTVNVAIELMPPLIFFIGQ